MKRAGKKGKKREVRELREVKVVVDGVVVADDWDDEGKVTDLCLLTTDDEEYYIENSEMLMKLIQKYIRASGVVRTHRNGEKSIHIKKCTVLEDELDDELAKRLESAA